MTNIHKTISYIYNPDNQSKEQLIDNFVVRIDLFKRLFNEIKTTKNNFPEQHYIIEGKRGMGKTTMLLRLNYEIENDPDLNTWLIPLVFNEEEYSINTLFKFWERIAALLEEYDTTFRGLSKEMDALYEKKQKHDTYEEDIFKLLIQYLRNHGKKIILFIDNFGDIFNKFKPREVQRLREVLQSNNDIGIVAGSSIILDAFHDVKHPFYEFFKIQRLRGLDRKEAEALLLKLDEGNPDRTIQFIIDNYGGRVEALRRLTGGVIRTIVLLFEIFSDDKNGDTFKDLETLLDRVTPLYKHRMDELPSAQQEIVEALALGWDGMTVKEIAQKTREESKVISAQMNQLVKNEVVLKIITNSKNHIYQIDERFFNIWYLMRYSRKGDIKKVIWLVRFLDDWCDESDLSSQNKKFIKALERGRYDMDGALYKTQAFMEAKSLSDYDKDALLYATRNFFAKNNVDYLKYLSKSDREKREEANRESKKGNYNQAIFILNQMKKPAYDEIAICYGKLGEFEKAESIYLKDFPKTEKWLLGWLYIHLKQYEKAEILFREGASMNVEEAYSSLAVALKGQKRYTEAERILLEGHEKGFDMDNDLEWFYKYDSKDYKKAEVFYLENIEKGKTKFLQKLAELYNVFIQDYKKAEEYYLKAIEYNHDSPFSELGDLYAYKFLDYRKAQYYYLKAIGNGDSTIYNELAWTYFKLKEFPTLAQFYIKIAQQIDLHDYYIFNCISLWNNNFISANRYRSELIYDENFLESRFEDIKFLLLLMLAKKQYVILYRYFTNDSGKELETKDRFKPIWYALMFYMLDQYPNEYLKMGEELRETVEEILAQVAQMAIDYAMPEEDNFL